MERHGTSLRSISAINISAYGRLEEFHESSEAREAKLSLSLSLFHYLLDEIAPEVAFHPLFPP